MHLVARLATLAAGFTVITASHLSRSTTGFPVRVYFLLPLFLFLLGCSGGRGYSEAAYSVTRGASAGSGERSVGGGTAVIGSTEEKREMNECS